jgi:hypothetical protein
MICDTARAPTESIAAELTVPERVLLFCLASDTNWVKAGVTHATAEHLLVRYLVERDHAGGADQEGPPGRRVGRQGQGLETHQRSRPEAQRWH